jgi:hypothetical protein
LKSNAALWLATGCSTALCVWNIIFNAMGKIFDNYEFAYLTFVVIPFVLMAHTQVTAGGYSLKETGRIAAAWFSGWLIKPFSGMPALIDSIGSFAADGKRQNVKKAAAGIAVTIPLLFIIISLLSGADMVFGYYLRRLTESLNISSLIGHIVIVIIAFALFYSFLWNVGFGPKNKPIEKISFSIDALAGGIVLAAVIAVYILFCAIQFTYLFARAGLPLDLTYSEYARQGFAQTVAVCAINLLIYGVY